MDSSADINDRDTGLDVLCNQCKPLTNGGNFASVSSSISNKSIWCWKKSVLLTPDVGSPVSKVSQNKSPDSLKVLNKEDNIDDVSPGCTNSSVTCPPFMAVLVAFSASLRSIKDSNIAIELPKCTAGLNIWRDGDIFKSLGTVFLENMGARDQLRVINSSEYFPYKVGYMCEQDGLLRHQITVGGDIMENEMRVTLQGHIVETEKEIILYV